MYLKCLSHVLFFKQECPRRSLQIPTSDQTNVYHFGDFSLIGELTIEVLNNYEIFGGIESTGVASANYIRSMFGPKARSFLVPKELGIKCFAIKPQKERK